MAPRGGGDDRQAVSERLGIGHAVALVKGRQHEDIGLGISGAEARRRPFADAARRDRQTMRRDGARDRRRRLRVARQAADAAQPPGAILERGQRLDQQQMTFARRQAADRQQMQRPLRAVSRCGGDAGFSVPGGVTAMRSRGTP